MLCLSIGALGACFGLLGGVSLLINHHAVHSGVMFAETTWVAANITPERTSGFFGGDESVHVEQTENASQIYLALSVTLQEPTLLIANQNLYPGHQYIGKILPGYW